MGILRSPKTLDQIIGEHIASMRSYADSLDDGLPLIGRKKVVARIRKCAAEIERAQAAVKMREAAMRAASAIEARSDATPKSGAAEGESAVAKPDAQKGSA